MHRYMLETFAAIQQHGAWTTGFDASRWRAAREARRLAVAR